MAKYTLADKAAGEEIEVDADRLERVTGVQIGQIERVLEEDRDFVNGDREVQSRSKEQAGLLPLFESVPKCLRKYELLV